MSRCVEYHQRLISFFKHMREYMTAAISLDAGSIVSFYYRVKGKGKSIAVFLLHVMSTRHDSFPHQQLLLQPMQAEGAISLKAHTTYSSYRNRMSISNISVNEPSPSTRPPRRDLHLLSRPSEIILEILMWLVRRRSSACASTLPTLLKLMSICRRLRAIISTSSRLWRKVSWVARHPNATSTATDAEKQTERISSKTSHCIASAAHCACFTADAGETLKRICTPLTWIPLPQAVEEVEFGDRMGLTIHNLLCMLSR